MNGESDNCGCCAGVQVETPAALDNRPGLPAISYRAGTHATFQEAMLARLSGSDFPAPGALSTRAADDFSIALLDAWASVADVLTFYQERIANENYLRTATERFSLLEMARLLGYRAQPGLAANVDLAFTVETAQVAGVPKVVALPAGLQVQSLPGPGEEAQTFETAESIEARPAWNVLAPQRTQLVLPAAGAKHTWLRGTSTGLKTGDALLFLGEAPILANQPRRWCLRLVTKVQADSAADRTLVEWADGLDAPPVPPSSGAIFRSYLGSSLAFRPLDATPFTSVYVFRKRAGLFGSNAPHPSLLPAEVTKDKTDDTTGDWKFSLEQSLNLDASYPGIAASAAEESWLVLALRDNEQLYRIGGVSESAPNRYLLTTRTTRLELDTSHELANFAADLRSVVVFAQSERLDFAAIPRTTPVQGSVIALAAPVSGLEKGRRLIVSGQTPEGLNASETATLEQVSSDGRTLTLSAALKNRYTAATAAIFANVAAATHGETRQEVLGSGDAARAWQQFTLKQPPLTYVSSATAAGADSTLRLRVNDLLWQEVPSLHGHGPAERIFITTQLENGKTTVTFGDGQTSARLPTGRENISALYRRGLGAGGNLQAGQLSLLLSRPLGLKAVSNPQPSTGGANAETAADLRANAPLTVLTLERVVSLRDYEDFARSFAGVARASATWSWTGERRGIFLTVAGPNGAPISAGSALHSHLLAALRAAGDPHVPLRVQTFRPAFFRLGVRVKIDPAYDVEKTLGAVEAALREAFSFAARAFGQAVAASEVLAALHTVAGVMAGDLTRFSRADDPSDVQAFLLAAAPQAGAGDAVAAAELLTLADGPLDELGVLA